MQYFRTRCLINISSRIDICRNFYYQTNHQVTGIIKNHNNCAHISTSQNETKTENTKDSQTSDSTTHFGFQTIKESEKEQKVYRIFEDVAKSYDFMNDVMSMGIHRFWKDIFIERLCPVQGIKLLDMAGGTGDIAFRCIKYLQNQKSVEGETKKPSQITICDINQNMLDVGKIKAERLGYIENNLNDIKIDWVCADAENLPFESNVFHTYTIAFGVRNCTHIDKVLNEAYRVLQPGGRFMCLEFSHLTNDKLQWLYDQYSFQIIPPMGQILTGQWNAYQYLVESIRKFPKQDDFKNMIENAGFSYVKYSNMTFGIVSIHSGFKL